MNARTAIVLTVAVAAAVARAQAPTPMPAPAHTQQPGAQPFLPPTLPATLPPLPGQQQPTEAMPYLLSWEYGKAESQGDFTDTIFYGGFQFEWPALRIVIRGKNGILRSDREQVRDLMQPSGGKDDPPRRGIEPPAPRRRLSPEAMHERLEQFMRAMGQTAPPLTTQQRVAYEVPRFLYFEGDVSVFRGDVEVARCERLWISPQDDRMVVEGAELRYRTTDERGKQETFVVRGPRLVKQGNRWTGRDLSFTTCEAGVPHTAVQSGELEIVERGEQFEVWSRGNTLQLGGIDLLPLPDAHFFTGEQSQIPLKGASFGYSGREGVRSRLRFGLPWNRSGGAVHEWLTGRPANEFRGNWELDTGWIEKRGFPLAGSVDYRAKGLYEGRTDAFWMDDDGPNRREVTNYLDGAPIDDRNRELLRTENRVHLGEETHLDVSAFQAGDPAVYPEFFGGDYRSRKTPESSAYLHSADDNLLLTVGTRFNLDEFSYRDNRSLAPSFVEELPVATLHWLAQPIATTPWDTPIVLDAATEVGERRRDFDERFLGPHGSDTTLRLDQSLELSAPFLLGPLNVRPFGETRMTYYDETVAGGSDARLALTAGVRAGARFQRTWGWLDDQGVQQGVRHVMSPIVTFADRFHVDGQPSDFRQFDATDALSEQQLVRVEMRNLLQRMDAAPEQPTTYDFLFLDLAQDFWPDARRDNAGDELGLFYYDFLVRPRAYWLPFDNFAYGIYGDHDWEDGLRTFDTELQFGKLLGCDWTLDYRRDARVDGAVGFGASTNLYGRWDLSGMAQYDLQNSDFIHYGIGLERRDHDWTVRVGLDYDPFDDQLSFRIDFVPRLPGASAPRERDWYGSQRQFQQRSAAGY